MFKSHCEGQATILSTVLVRMQQKSQPFAFNILLNFEPMRFLCGRSYPVDLIACHGLDKINMKENWSHVMPA